MRSLILHGLPMRSNLFQDLTFLDSDLRQNEALDPDLRQGEDTQRQDEGTPHPARFADA